MLGQSKTNPKATSICCDSCGDEKAHFLNAKQAADWLADRDEDFEEYGQFSDGVPRVGDLFLIVTGKLWCSKCVQAEINRVRSSK